MSPRFSDVLVFELAGDIFAIPLDAIREILPLPFLSKPPGLPSILAGFLNLGGQAISVLNLKRLFDMPDSVSGPYSHVVVLKQTNVPLGLLVDRSAGTAAAPPESFVPVADGHSLNDCVEADVRIGNQTAHVLSVERLLLKQERARVGELQAMEQKRLERLEESSQ